MLNGKFQLRATLALLAFACVLRVVFLGADPYYYRWISHVTDEGRWTEHARRAALGGPLVVSSGHNEHLILAPVFSAVSYAAFRVGGVDRVSARWFPALAGCALLLMLWLLLRSRVPPEALLAGIATIALQADIVMLSRVAIPEIPLALIALSGFYCFQGRDRPRPIIAAVLCAAMLGMKGTGLPLVALFALLAFCYRAGPVTWRDRARWDVALRYAGVIAAFAVTSIAGVLLIFPERAAGLLDDFGVMLSFLFRSPTLDYLGTVPTQNPLSPTLNLCALGAWLAWVGGLQPSARDEDAAFQRLSRGAWLWFLSYPFLILAMGYFPERYQVHVVIPTALLVAVGVTRMRRGSAAALVEPLSRSGPIRRAAFWVPSALWCAPLLAALGVAAGLPADRVRWKLLIIGCCCAASFVLGARLRLDKTRARFAVAFPWWCASIWFAAYAWLPGHFPFWPTDPTTAAAGVVIVVLSAGLTALSVGPRCRRLRPHTITAVALWFSLMWAVHLAPGYLSPVYRGAEISRALGRSLANADTVIVQAAETAFLDNAVLFRGSDEPDLDDRSRDSYLVTAFYVEKRVKRLEERFGLSQRYEVVDRHEVYVPEPYLRLCDPGTVACEHRSRFITVYRRRAPRPNEAAKLE